MTTKDFIEGLQIFGRYTDTKYGIGAEHDIVYVYATTRPVAEPDLTRLINLGWFQENTEWGNPDEMAASDYDPEESWAACV